MTFTYDYATNSGDLTPTTVDQGLLASTYTNALRDYLQTADGADVVAYLSFTDEIAGSIETALEIKAAIMANAFTLTGLFGAAQSKTGEVSGDSITNPVPVLSVTLGEVTYNIDLTAMLSGLETETWLTTVKKDTIYHTREFYSSSVLPEGYDDTWSVVENQAPVAEPIVITFDEYDDKAVHDGENAGDKTFTIDLLDPTYVTDEDGDALTVIITSELPAGVSKFLVDGAWDGHTLVVDRDSTAFDAFLDGTDNNTLAQITYTISDGVNDPVENTVSLTVIGTADLESGTFTFTQTKIADVLEYSGSEELLGFDQEITAVAITGSGDFDFKNESYAVTGDVTGSYTGLNEGGRNGVANNESVNISVSSTDETFVTAVISDDTIDYNINIAGPVAAGSTVTVTGTYDYWI